jgi:hypothetical protein
MTLSSTMGTRLCCADVSGFFDRGVTEEQCVLLIAAHELPRPSPRLSDGW